MRDRDRVQRQWQQRIRAQRRSGVPVTEFCRREGINKAGFYYWKRRVTGVRQEDFVELKVVPGSRTSLPASSPAVRASSAIEVRLANGRSLLVPAGFDADHLAKLIAAVEVLA